MPTCSLTRTQPADHHEAVPFSTITDASPCHGVDVLDECVNRRYGRHHGTRLSRSQPGIGYRDQRTDLNHRNRCPRCRQPMFSDAETAAARTATRRCHGSGLEDD